MARKRVNSGGGIQLVGFWNREDAIEGRILKRVETKDENVFFIIQLTADSDKVHDKNDKTVLARRGQCIGVGLTSALACLKDLIDKPGIVYLTSNGERDFEAIVKGKKVKRTFWDIAVEHDDEADLGDLPEATSTEGSTEFP